MLHPANVPARLHVIGSRDALIGIDKGLFRRQLVATERQGKTIKLAQLSEEYVIHGCARRYRHKDLPSYGKVFG
jgi:hypothetical protein